jgi:hypothetical protein
LFCIPAGGNARKISGRFVFMPWYSYFGCRSCFGLEGDVFFEPSAASLPDMAASRKYDTANIAGRLSDCETYLKCVSKKMARAVHDVKQTQRQKRKLHNHIMQVALVLRIQSQGTNNLHVDYLRKRKSELRCDIDLSKAAEELDAELDNIKLSDVVDIATGHCGNMRPRVFRDAKRFTDEAAIHAWVVQQNVVQGIAPPAKKVCEFRRGLQRITEDLGTHDEQTVPLLAGEKKWVQRFRVRWDFTVGKISAGDVVPVTELRKKDT